MIQNPRDNQPTLNGKTIVMRPTVLGDSVEFSEVAPIDTFDYFVSSVPKEQSIRGFNPLVEYMLTTPSVCSFTILDQMTSEVVGSSSFMDIRPDDDHVEIGMTWYAPKWRGTRVNPECKFLMLSYAFDVLKCERVTLKCDDRNVRSKAAILKLEGTLRRHRRMQNGFMRDTTYFSILSDEWPEIKSSLEARLNSYE
jgi:RimJ/RimL family protein N-acetyltransferase